VRLSFPISTASCVAGRHGGGCRAHHAQRLRDHHHLAGQDTSHKTVFPVFTAGGGFGMPEMEGGCDMLMIADPSSFRVLALGAATGCCSATFISPTGRRCRVDPASLPAGAAPIGGSRLRFQGRPRGRATSSSSTIRGSRRPMRLAGEPPL